MAWNSTTMKHLKLLQSTFFITTTHMCISHSGLVQLCPEFQSHLSRNCSNGTQASSRAICIVLPCCWTVCRLQRSSMFDDTFDWHFLWNGNKLLCSSTILYNRFKLKSPSSDVTCLLVWFIRVAIDYKSRHTVVNYFQYLHQFIWIKKVYRSHHRYGLFSNTFLEFVVMAW